MANNSGILLESGTNELEIVVFSINNELFGINVLKVKEIIQPLPITMIPHAHPHILGVIQLRGEVLPVISLEQALGISPNENCEVNKDKFIVAEYYQQKLVFHVHHVKEILRVSWEQIEKPTDLYSVDEALVTGIVKQNENIILLLDFEKIIADINPNKGMNSSKLQSLSKRERSNKRIFVVEDSPLLRDLLKKTLVTAGYENLLFFENGKEAYDYIQQLIDKQKNVYNEIQLIITDIEMPQMDGHHLIRKIRNHPEIEDLPVIIFSSMITDELYHKGEAVGATDQVAKPDIENLVAKIDRYIL